MTSPTVMPVSTRTPGPVGRRMNSTVPGAGAKSCSASSALNRASTACPNSGGGAHARRPDVAVLVGDDLDLDVSAALDQPLHEDHRVDEGALRLDGRALEGVG